MTTSLSKPQVFIQNYEAISAQIQEEILANKPYTIYSQPVSVELVTHTALTILKAMKIVFSEEKNLSSNEVILDEKNLGENLFTCDLRPLYGIFARSGITVHLISEKLPPDAFPQLASIKKIAFQMTYTTPEIRLTFNDNFKCV